MGMKTLNKMEIKMQRKGKQERRGNGKKWEREKIGNTMKMK